jgi:lipopolysaccharide transport system permease protein
VGYPPDLREEALSTTASELKIVVHGPEQQLRHPGILIERLFRDLVRSRHVAFEMAKRDLKSQYRTSVLGALIPLLPALTTAAWAILFRDAHLINVGNVNMPYPFFVLCGMMLWAAFLESMDAPISGVMAEQGLLSKADVPPEAVSMSRLGQVGFNFGVKAALILIAAALYRVHVPWTILFAPFGLILLMMLGVSIGLILAPLNLLYTDVAKALPVVTTFWFFTTPIIFTAPKSGWAAVVMLRLNPVTPLMTTTRELAFVGALSMVRGLEVATSVTFFLFAVAMVFHRVAMPIVIDRANA